jgi:hypothetical protein
MVTTVHFGSLIQELMVLSYLGCLVGLASSTLLRLQVAVLLFLYLLQQVLDGTDHRISVLTFPELVSQANDRLSHLVS